MKAILPLLASLGLAQFASAQIVTLPVQTIPFGFVPNGVSAPLVFDKFDDMGGTRQLLSVAITVAFEKTGGNTAIDNDSAVGGSIDLTHTVTGQLSVVSGGVALLNAAFQPIGGSSMLTATSTFNTNVSATSGDSVTEFNVTNASDYANFSPAPLSISDSGTVAPSLTSLYVGVGANEKFSLEFAALQSVSATGLSGLQQVFTVSSVSGSVGVQYTYQVVPEASVSILAGLSVLGLMRRRR